MSVGPKTKGLLISCLCVLAGIVLLGLFLSRHWPYREAAIRSQLSTLAGAQVSFGHFRPQYWSPGCVAEDVVLRRANSSQPIATIRRLTITSNPLAFLHHRVTLVRAQGMHIRLNRSDLAGKGSGSNQSTTDKFEAQDSVLEVSGKDPEHSLTFNFRSFSISRTPGSKLTQFAAEFENPLPKGKIRSSGEFGPWNGEHPEQTQVSGSYALERAELGVFAGIAGLTSSTGSFQGNVGRLEVRGSTSTPRFKLTSTEHELPLETHFTAQVDTANGDVTLRDVKARFGRDEIDAHGTIARDRRGQRAAILDFNCQRGQVEDTFYPFVHSPASPLSGAVAFHMHVILTGGSESFLERIKLESDFHIQHARFTRWETQFRVNRIGRPAHQGETQPTSSFSDFAGKVRVLAGVAHFSELSVEDGGASARFRGSYNLVDERVDMHGRLKTETSLASTTHGVKAVFAKVLEPFFKKKPHENVVPVKIGGTYSHPNFGLDLNQKDGSQPSSD